MDFAAIEQKIHYSFHDKGLLELAFIHRSQAYIDEVGRNLNNQRLEFLGDSVLGLVIAQMLYTQFPDAAEGDLSKRLVALVNGEVLAEIAREIGLGDYLDVSDSEAAHGGRANASNLEDALEALVGAMYLDGGLEPAKAFIARFWQQRVQNLTTAPKDPKTTLQEWVQAKSWPLPEYVVVGEEGPSHAPIFTIEVHIREHAPVRASAGNKKLAEREAASKMLKALGVGV